MFKKISLIVLLILLAIFVFYYIANNRLIFTPEKDYSIKGDTSKPAEKVYKNIQVLKGLPSYKLLTVMHYYSASLDEECEFCHVTNQKDSWDKDDKDAKKTAREMVRMVNQINENNFDGKELVSCATCHHGSSTPSISAPLLIEELEVSEDRSSLPQVNVILDKYYKAIGGKDGFENFKTRITTGEMTMNNGSKQQVEIKQTAPDKYLFTSTSDKGTAISKGYNGTLGWRKTPGMQRELGEDDLMDIKEEGVFYKQAEIEKYTKMEVKGIEKIGDKKTYQVQGIDNFGCKVKLYFDADSGFLRRVEYYKPNPFGFLPVEINYNDYRMIDGVMMPYMINWHTAFNDQTLKISEIKNNPPIDEQVYNMPK